MAPQKRSQLHSYTTRTHQLYNARLPKQNADNDRRKPATEVTFKTHYQVSTLAEWFKCKKMYVAMQIQYIT